MTRRDTLKCAHEPFGDSFYYGPERLSERYSDEDLRESSGFSKTTYQEVLNRLERDEDEVGFFLFSIREESITYTSELDVLTVASAATPPPPPQKAVARIYIRDNMVSDYKSTQHQNHGCQIRHQDTQ
jgi:hypothetical protein